MVNRAGHGSDSQETLSSTQRWFAVSKGTAHWAVTGCDLRLMLGPAEPCGPLMQETVQMRNRKAISDSWEGP